MAYNMAVKLASKIDSSDLIDYINTAEYLELHDIVEVLSNNFCELIEKNSIKNIRTKLSVGDHFSTKDEETIRNNMVWTVIQDEASADIEITPVILSRSKV